MITVFELTEILRETTKDMTMDGVARALIAAFPQEQINLLLERLEALS